MKPEDVMKALECCAKPYSLLNKVARCKTCPYWERECYIEFIPDVLALLRKKEEEIERLKEMNNALSAGFDTVKADTVRKMRELLLSRIASLEYRARSTRKTIDFDRLHEQVGWVLHEVVPTTIEEVVALMLKEAEQ